MLRKLKTISEMKIPPKFTHLRFPRTMCTLSLFRKIVVLYIDFFFNSRNICILHISKLTFPFKSLKNGFRQIRLVVIFFRT